PLRGLRQPAEGQVSETHLTTNSRSGFEPVSNPPGFEPISSVEVFPHGTVQPAGRPSKVTAPGPSSLPLGGRNRARPDARVPPTQLARRGAPAKTVNDQLTPNAAIAPASAGCPPQVRAQTPR